MAPTIQVFATDFKRRDDWHLPFIRIGTTPGCNAALHVGRADGSFEQYGLPVSEFNTIWHVAEHLNDFGRPDYVGFCHYRRFFTTKVDHGILPIKTELVDPSVVFSPSEQLAFMEHHKVDGLVPCAFIEHYRQDRNSTHFNDNPSDVAEYFWIQLEEDGVGITLDEVKTAIRILQQNVPLNLQAGLFKALAERAVHFGTIFTMRKSLFECWWSIIKPTMLTLLAAYGRDRLMQMNCRVGGYLLERLTSCIIWAFIHSGANFVHLPLVVADFEAKPAYRATKTADTGMACDVEAMTKDHLK